MPGPSKSERAAVQERLGTFLKALREEKGVGVRELARSLGVSHSFVQKTESGERRLAVTELIDICRVYDISAGDIVAQFEAHEPKAKD